MTRTPTPTPTTLASATPGLTTPGPKTSARAPMSTPGVVPGGAPGSGPELGPGSERGSKLGSAPVLAAPPRAGATILEIAGAAFAFGLSWRRLKGDAAADREACAEARRLGAVAVAVRAQKRHFGFARGLELPRLRRVRVAAAAVADAFPHTMLGAWPLADGRWWCVALDRGEVYPLFGDRIVADEVAARRWFDDHRQENDWSTLAVPVAWERERATEVDLDPILAGHATTALEPVAAVTWVPRRAAALTTALAVAGAAALWLLVEIGSGAPRPVPVAVAPPPALPSPDPLPSPALLAPPTVVAAICARLLRGVGPALPGAGWRGTSAECRLDAEAMRVRLTATARPVVAEVMGLLPIRLAGVTVDHAQGVALIERSLALPSRQSLSGSPSEPRYGPPHRAASRGRGPEPDADHRGGARRDPAVGRAVGASQVATRRHSPPSAAPLPAPRVATGLALPSRAASSPGSVADARPAASVLRWSAREVASLAVAVAALEAVAGLRLTRIGLDLNSFVWTLEGEADVAPPPV